MTETTQATTQATTQVTTQVTPQPTPQVKSLVFILKQQRLTVAELIEVLNLKSRKNFMTNYLRPAIEAGWVVLLYPDKPNHPDQRYYLTEAGLQILMNDSKKIVSR